MKLKCPAVVNRGFIDFPSYINIFLSVGFPGGKEYRCGAYNSPKSSVKIKNGGAIPPIPHMSSWYSAYLIKHGQSYLYQNFDLLYSLLCHC
jgi:hypothetical protein